MIVRLLTTLLTSLLIGLGQLVAQSDSLLLSIDTTLELGAITVRARPIAHGASATRQLRQLDIYLDPAAKADPLLAVQALPAATTTGETANVSLRGSRVGATGVYLDGIPLRSAVRIDQVNGLGQFSIFGQLPLREVTVYAAAPPVAFSQAAAGAIAVETRDARPKSALTSASLHLGGSGLSHERPLGERSSLNAYVNAGDLRAFRGLNGRRLADLRSARSLDGMVNYRTGTGKNGRLNATYLGFHENYDYQLRTLELEGNIRQERNRHLFLLSHRGKVGKWSTRIDQLTDLDGPRFQLSGNETAISQRTHYQAIHLNRGLPGRTTGMGLMNHVYVDRTSGNSGGTDFRIDETHTVTELYLSHQQRLGDRILLGGGLKPALRLDKHDWRWTAQFSARYQPDERHRLSLSGGQFQQFLPPSRLVTDWQWLRSRQLALEYEHQRKYWSAGGAAFLKQDDYAGETDVLNGGEAWARYRRPGWRGEVAANSFGQLRLRLRREFGVGWTVGLAHTHWQAERAEQTAYHRLDGSVSKMWVVGEGVLIVYLNTNNLPDRRNVSHLSRRGEEYFSRRVVFFGATYSFSS